MIRSILTVLYLSICPLLMFACVVLIDPHCIWTIVLYGIMTVIVISLLCRREFIEEFRGKRNQRWIKKQAKEVSNGIYRS